MGDHPAVPFPKEIMIEATNHCNNKCFFCGSTVSNRERGYIDTSFALELIREAYEKGCRRISFHGMGEPFLHKDLAVFVHEAKKCEYEYIYLDTNGTMAGQGRVEEVLDAGLDSLKFSVHATTAKTFYNVTKNDCFDRVLKNALFISEYIKSNKLKCKTIAYCAVSKMNEGEAQRFRELWGGFFDETWIRPIHNGCGVKEDNIDWILEDRKEEFAAMRTILCPELYRRLIVDWQGKAIGCCTDWTGALVYGDLRTDSMEDVWNNDEINRLREQHRLAETLPDVCSLCMGYKK